MGSLLGETYENHSVTTLFSVVPINQLIDGLFATLSFLQPKKLFNFLQGVHRLETAHIIGGEIPNCYFTSFKSTTDVKIYNLLFHQFHYSIICFK
jgi:hypothetical protein